MPESRPEMEEGFLTADEWHEAMKISQIPKDIFPNTEKVEPPFSCDMRAIKCDSGIYVHSGDLLKFLDGCSAHEAFSGLETDLRKMIVEIANKET